MTIAVGFSLPASEGCMCPTSQVLPSLIMCMACLMGWTFYQAAVLKIVTHIFPASPF